MFVYGKDKIFIIVFNIILVYLFGCSSKKEESRAEIKITDDMGIEIRIDKTPERVISTAPNLTEMVYKLGGQNSLIGVTSYCNYPSEAKSKEKIGDMLNFNIEKIVSMKPDLVLMTIEGNTKQAYQKLNSLGIKVFVSNPRNLTGIEKTIKDIAGILNKSETADSIIKSNHKKILNIANEMKSMKKYSAMFMVSDAPIMLAGDNTFINEILTAAGAENIVKKSPMAYPQYSREEILNKNPEVIIIPTTKGDKKGELVSLYKEWSGLTAIEKNNIITVEPDIFLRPGPRYIEAIEILNRKLKEIK